MKIGMLHDFCRMSVCCCDIHQLSFCDHINLTTVFQHIAHDIVSSFFYKLDYVHFKDVNETVYRQVLGEHIRFFDGCGKGAMCPIGTGSLDYPAIKQALSDIGYSGYITIEQERDPRNSDTSLRDVKASVDYLKSVGYEI